MDCKIFYSWQSDLPSQTNEQFIEETLKNVIRKIKDDSSLDVNLTLDRDIANVPGSPDVVATILAKIEESDIFVCDVSIINKRQSRNNPKTKKIRLTSNPNVLVEFGYALKARGTDKIILVNNLAFGKHEDLPFDFRHKHVIGYNLSQESTSEQREAECHSLEAQIEQKLCQIILTLKEAPSQKPTPYDQAMVATENSQPNQTILINQYIDWVINKLKEWSPPFPKAVGNELDIIMKSIDQTADLVLDFTRLFSNVANSDSAELVLSYKKIFERIIIEYNVPIGFEGSYNPARIQFYKFIGHELFISLIALLIDIDKLDIVADILSEALYVENTYYAGPQNVSYTYISIAGESSREVSYPTLAFLAEKFNQRHSEGKLAGLMPMIKLTDAEFFLSLRNAPQKWCTVTDKYWFQQPKFLVRASDRKYAQKLLKPLAVDSVDQLKGLLASRRIMYRWLFGFDPNSIASD